MATNTTQKSGTRARSGGDKSALAAAIAVQPKPDRPVKSMPAPENLIPVREGEIDGVKCLVVDARDLHQFLGARRGFAHWMSDRIAQYDLVEGDDFSTGKLDSSILTNQVETGVHGGDRRSMRFTLSLRTAQELAMVERTEKGREVRRYFIRCEQELLAKRASHPTAEAMTRQGLGGLIRERCLHGAVVEYARSLEIVGKQKQEIAWEMAKGAYDKKRKAIIGTFRKGLQTGFGRGTLREFMENGIREIEAAQA